MKSQNKKILDELLKGVRLSRAGAYALGLGLSLNSRISDLRSEGYPIKDYWVTTEKTRFKMYFLEKEYIEEYKKSINLLTN